MPLQVQQQLLRAPVSERKDLKKRVDAIDKEISQLLGCGGDGGERDLSGEAKEVGASAS